MTSDPSRFHYEFACPGCAENGNERTIRGTTWLAIAQGTGLEIACRECRWRFIVTTEGATPFRGRPSGREFLDASGKKYVPNLPPPIQPKLPNDRRKGNGRKANQS